MMSSLGGGGGKGDESEGEANAERFVLFSGHDDQIMAVLIALGVDPRPIW